MEYEYKIYGLRIIGTDEIKYVGRTYESLKNRLSKHKTNARLDKKKCHRHYWILKHYDQIEIVLIEGGIRSFQESCEKEIYYISEYRKISNIINLTDGGDGGCPGYKHTEEAKMKISKANKGKIIPEEVRRKLRGPRDLSPETRKFLSENGKKHNKGEGNPMWGRKRPDTAELNRQRTGWKMGEETKKKMSDMRKGEKHPNCKLGREDALLCIKLRRHGMSAWDISQKFGVKKSYVLMLVNLSYKRKDVDYEKLDEILRDIDISRFFEGNIPEPIEISKRCQKISNEDLIKIKEDWNGGKYKTYKEVGDRYNITGQYARALILGIKGKKISISKNQFSESEFIKG